MIGADPGFPVGGGASPRGGGRSLAYHFAKSFQNMHGIEKSLGRRGRPLDPPQSC